MLFWFCNVYVVLQIVVFVMTCNVMYMQHYKVIFVFVVLSVLNISLCYAFVMMCSWRVFIWEGGGRGGYGVVLFGGV